MFDFFKNRTQDPRKELHTLLGNYEVENFPAAVMNVLTTLRDPDSSITDIAQQIEIDPGIHVRVLRTTNSAAYGLITKVSNIRHAANLLGRSRIEALVLSHAVTSALPSDNTSCIDHNRFWTKAAKRASLARSIAMHLHPATQVESFTVGLLQDIAIPVLAKFKEEEYRKVYERYSSDKEARLDLLEQEAFGYDHPAVGALMLEAWSFPDYLIRAIAGHHSWDEEAQVEPAVRLVSLLRYDNGDGDDGMALLRDNCQHEYGMSEEMISGLIDQASENAESFAKIIS
ncbi:MAG: HDOD domain-containing protein [Deltaproteobacteria bacterium]|nr:HDOD domain-containing protein [Deltaproteobacteria bacterium]